MSESSALPASVASQFSTATVAELIRLRRALHEDPELAFAEEHTAGRLYHALSSIRGAVVRRVTATGLVARIAGRNPKVPVVAIRGDIDALPIHEETGLSYASKTPGVMHACGHDIHATWAVGAAQLLAAAPAAGDVIVLLQPAEETGAGALAMLEAGALDGVSVIFGGHVDRRFDVGHVVADVGPLAASADTFTIELIGQGAHAARPHEAADPIVGAGALISAMQTIVARRLNPATPGVVTIASVHAGTAPNVIPERATLSGTVRSVEPQSRRLMLDEVKRIAESVAESYRLSARVVVEMGTPPLVNSARAAGWAQQAAVELLGEPAVVRLGFLNLAGEDFAHYLAQLDGCFLRIGAREAGGAATAAHSSRFAPSEDAIFVGAAVLAQCARVASQSLAEEMEPPPPKG